MKILSVSGSNCSVNFNGISLSKGFEKGVKVLKKSSLQNFTPDRKLLPPQNVTNVLNGASIPSRTGSGEIVTDIEAPNILDSLKQAKNIMLGRYQFEGIESGVEKAAEGDVSVSETVGKTVDDVIDLIFNWS